MLGIATYVLSLSLSLSRSRTRTATSFSFAQAHDVFLFLSLCCFLAGSLGNLVTLSLTPPPSTHTLTAFLHHVHYFMWVLVEALERRRQLLSHALSGTRAACHSRLVFSAAAAIIIASLVLYILISCCCYHHCFSCALHTVVAGLAFYIKSPSMVHECPFHNIPVSLQSIQSLL